VINIATFDVIPKDDWFPIWFSLEPDDLKSMEDGPYNDQFDLLGFISRFFVMNMGTLFLAWVYLQARVVIYLLLKYCFDCKVKVLRRWEKAVKEDLFWNDFITFLYASYIEIVFAVALNFTQVQWDTWGCYYSNFNFYLYIPVAMFLPYVIGFFCYWKYDDLPYYYIKRVFGAAYENIILYERPEAGLKPGIFLIHRQLIAGTLVFLPRAATFKCWCFILSCEAYTMFVTVVKPYPTPEEHKAEMFNLVCVVIILYHMLWFTEFVPDAEDKYNLGFSMIFFLGFNVCWNLFWLILHSIQGLI